jgi:hypothetical protein
VVVRAARPVLGRVKRAVFGRRDWYPAPPAEVAALFEAPITPADFFVRPAWVAADVRRRGLSC